MKKYLLLLVLIHLSSTLLAQNAKKHRDYVKEDSIFMAEPYPYILPVLGDKAHEKGYKFLLPFGIMFNTLVVKQDVEISDLSVGFGNHETNADPNMIDLNEVTAFDPVTTQTSTYNFRFDVWPLPFFNVYGLGGATRKTKVDVNMTQPFPLAVATEFSGWYVGYGAMINGKVGPIFLSLDGNQTHNHNPKLRDPVVFNMLSFRAGPIFNFPRHPEKRIVVWLGAMYSHFNARTVGKINTVDLAPNAPNKVDEMHSKLDNWYDELGPIKQNLYKDLHDKLGNGLDGLKNGINNSFIAYDMNKASPKPWNMLTGVQYQHNDHWQARVEAQYLGARIAGLFSINYRFGIKGRTWGSGGR